MWHKTCARCATGTAAHHTADGTGCDEVNSEHGSLQGTAPRAGRCRGRPSCWTCLTCANESGGGLLDAARRPTLSRRRVQGDIRGHLPARFAMKSMPAHLLFAAAGVGAPPQRQHVLAQGLNAEHASLLWLASSKGLAAEAALLGGSRRS